MKGFLLVAGFLFLFDAALAQCTDAPNKLLPDYAGQKSLYPSAVATGGNYFAVGLAGNDTTGHASSGGVYVYERSGTSWHFLALLKCSDPLHGTGFGSHVSMDSTGSTIAVSSTGSFLRVASEVYIFKKPAGGWIDATETLKLALPAGALTNGLGIGKDGLTLAVSTGGSTQQLLVYERNSIGGDFSAATAASLTVPNVFPIGVYISVTSKYIGASFDETGDDQTLPGVVVYKRNQSLGYPQIAILKTSTLKPFYLTFDMTDNLISMGGHSLNASDDGYDNIITTFAKQKTEEWNSAVPGIALRMNNPNESTLDDQYTPVVNINDSTVAMGFRYSDYPFTGSVLSYGSIRVAHRTGSSWNLFSKQEIFRETTPYWPILPAMAWNGSQLIAPGTLNNTGSNFLSAITSITRDASGLWGNEFKVRLPGLNSELFHFGTSVMRATNSLIVGSPGDDEVGPNAGAVVIYTLNAGKQWVKKSKILPDYLNGDMKFGELIACGDSILAITGPGYPYVTGGGAITNKVSLYKRTGPDWSSHTFYQDVDIPHTTKISISSNLMVTSGSETLSIYKRTTSGYSFHQEFKFDVSFNTSQQGFQTQIMNDTIFVFSGYQSSQTHSFGAILVKDNSGNYVLSSTLIFPSVQFPPIGQDYMGNLNIEVANDQIFIGLPVAVVGGVIDAGAVVVYSKDAGQVWPAGELAPVAVITSPDNVAFGYFGASLTSNGNTLLVGAPGIGVSLIIPAPGAAYAFAANDSRWTSSHLVFKVHGDTPSTGDSDQFGYAVDSDANNYFIGAPLENSVKGGEGGAVYIVRQRVVQQLGPFCIGAATAITISAVPDGGIWSGPGVIDATHGIFDQNSLPPGNHEVLYYAADCSFLQHFFIQTLPAIEASVTTPLNIILCPGTKSAISVKPISGSTYEWYFEPTGSADFAIIPGESGSTLMIRLAGLYYCKVSNGSCTTNSINIQAGFDQPAATIGPQLILCHSTQTLSLLASPAGGTWSGNHVSGSSFNAVNLPNGNYPVVYTVLSTSGCQYVLHDSVQVKAIPVVSLVRSGDYCKTGNFILSATPSDPSWTYMWSYSSTSLVYDLIDTAVHSKETFTTNGFYKIFITNGVCTGETDPLPVTVDASIEISVTPGDSVINICSKGSVVLTAQAPDGTVFTWQKSNSRKGTQSDAGEGSSIELSDKGFINVKGVNGFCSAETPLQRVNILPADSLNVPNVFSPNGDIYNDTFISQGNVNTIFALIVNRWGEEVYRSDTLDWSGQGQPPGVYFWTVTYRDCKLEEKRAKGFVQLIR